MRRWLAVLAAAWLAWAGAAAAHEVRPALLQIVETTPGAYEVTWKQPTVGEMAVHLAPHLSGGALDRPPDAQSAAPGFLVKQWRVRGGGPLDGQTVSVEGLPQSVTDVLLRVTAANGRSVDGVLRPAHPSQVLDLGPPRGVAVPAYLRLGVEHILTGADHLLFVFGLLLLVGANGRLVKAITAFTVAHSITLALAALGYLRFPSATIEALVALSILFVAYELVPGTARDGSLARRSPWLIAFAFGLLHGMAFAGALAQIGLPPKAAPQALLLFNLGVEIGQLMFLGAAILVMAALRRLARALSWETRPWAQALPAYAIGGLSAYWLLERIAVAV